MKQKKTQSTMDLSKRVQEFHVMKDGKLETICSIEGKSFAGKPFVRSEKIELYKSCGYTVTNLDGSPA